MNTTVTILHHAAIVVAFLFWFYYGVKIIVIPCQKALNAIQNGNTRYVPVPKKTLFKRLLFMIAMLFIMLYVSQNVRPPVKHIVPPTSITETSGVEGDTLPPKKEVITLSVTEILAQKVAENKASNSNAIQHIKNISPISPISPNP